MSALHKLFTSVIPNRLAESMEAESRAGTLRCPCGCERSWWEAGGIRWRVAGHPRRLLRCPKCNQNTWHTICKQPVIAGPREPVA